MIRFALLSVAAMLLGGSVALAVCEVAGVNMGDGDLGGNKILTTIQSEILS